MGDASIDQYSGWMFGLATAYDLISDTKLRNMIKTDVKKFIDHLMDHQYTFHSVKGGNWPLSFPVSNGKKAITLSHIRAMAHMTNNKGKYKDEFEKKAKKWMGCAKKWLESGATTKNDWDLDKKNYFRFHIVALPLFTALRIENTDKIRDAWETILYNLWNGNNKKFKGVKNHKNLMFIIARMAGGHNEKNGQQGALYQSYAGNSYLQNTQ